MMVKGFTASLIVNRIYRPKPGDTILIHTAAGGVGMILSQWSKHLGATVIGTVGSQEKAKIAQAHGCDHAILYREVDFVAAVKAIAPQGVSAVFDGVGKDTFMASLDCVRPFGMLVNYGNASGHPPPIDLLQLAKRGSLSVCRPALSSLIADVARMRAAAAELFDLVARGILKIEIGGTYALSDAAERSPRHRGPKSPRARCCCCRECVGRLGCSGLSALPSPLWGGVGGGGRRYRAQNVLKNLVDVREHVVIPVAQHAIAVRFENPCALFVSNHSLCMLAAINLHDDALGVTREIRDVAPDSNLTAEVCARYREFVTQVPP